MSEVAFRKLIGRWSQSLALKYVLLLFFSGASFSAGVFDRLPESLASFAGKEILFDLGVEASLDAALAGVVGRILVLGILPIFLELARVILQILLQARRVIRARGFLRFGVRCRRLLDFLLIGLAEKAAICSLVFSFLVFSYLQFQSIRLLVGIMIISMGFTVVGVNNLYNAQRGRMRLPVRRKIQDGVIESYTIYAALSLIPIFAFFLGMAKVDSLIQYSPAVELEGYKGEYVLVVTLDEGLIVVEREFDESGVLKPLWRLIPNAIPSITFN